MARGDGGTGLRSSGGVGAGERKDLTRRAQRKNERTETYRRGAFRGGRGMQTEERSLGGLPSYVRASGMTTAVHVGYMDSRRRSASLVTTSTNSR